MDVRLTPTRGVQLRSVEDGAMLVNLDTGGCFELNRVGFEIWQLMSSGLTPASICDALASRYEIASATLETDVLGLLDSLVRQNLVQASGGPAASAR